MAISIHNSSVGTPTSILRKPLHHLVLGWILMVPFVFFAVRGNFSFQNGTDAAVAGSAFKDLVSSRSRGFVGSFVIPGVSLGLVVWFIVCNARSVLAFAIQQKLFSTLALLCLVSTVWSQDPKRTAINGFFYLLNTFFAFYLVLRFKPNDIMKLVIMGCGTITVLGLIMVFFFPQYGIVHSARDLGSWQGIYIDRNTFAKSTVFLLSPMLVIGRQKFTVFRSLFILLISFSIFKAHTATAIIVLLAYLLVMAGIHLSGRFERRSATLVISAFASVILILFTLGDTYLSTLLGLFGRDASLSGRTEIWGSVISSILKQPILGYGYYAFWLGLHGESANTILATHWVFSYAHNGILEIFLQLGVVGAALLCATFLQAVRNAVYCLKRPRTVGVDWLVGIIVLTAFYNIDEGTLMFPNEILSILYIVACCGLSITAASFREQDTRVEISSTL